VSDVAADDLAIRNLVASFALAAMQRDYQRFSETWAPNGTWRISPPINVEFTTRANIASAIPSMLARWEWFIQIPHSGVITLDGHSATGEWIMSERAKPATGGGGHFNHGLYRDVYVRHGERWMFAERTYHYLYIDQSEPAGQGGLLGKV
jgi:SnoaL-like domain